MVRVAPFPVGKYHRLRLQLANHLGDSHLVVFAHFQPGVRQPQISPHADFQNLRRVRGFAQTCLRRSARAGLSLGQIENPGAVSLLRHFQHCSAAGQLHVIRMRRNRQQINFHGPSVRAPILAGNEHSRAMCWHRPLSFFPMPRRNPR